MGQTAAELLVEINGSEAGLDAVLARVEAELQRTNTTANTTTATTSALAAELSRNALAAGDAAEALRLMDVALGKSNTDTAAGTETSLASARAEAGLQAALGNRTGAIELLEAAIAAQTERTNAVIAAERQLITIEDQAIAAATREADANVRLGVEHARTALASKDQAGALAILNQTQAQASGASEQVKASLATQIAATETAGTVTGQMGAQLAAFVGPAALIGVALGAATKIVQSFADAIHFVGALEEERTAFGGIIGDFQKGNAILEEATARGKAYGFTQKEITDAFKQLAPIIRESTSSTQAQTEALARIAVLKPEEPVQALSQAIDGLKKGRFTELAGELGVSKTEAKALTDEVAHGADAFTVLNRILDQHGITLDVAKQRTQGLAGAEREEAQAAEDLAIAQGKFAAGPGLALMEEQIRLTSGATRILTGDFAAMGLSLQASGQDLANSTVGAAAYATALASGASPAEALVAANNAATASINAFAGATHNGGGGTWELATATTGLGAAMDDVRSAVGKAQVATDAKADADTVAAVDAQTHAVAQEALSAAAQRDAQALLNAGAAGRVAAANLANSSSLVDVLTAAFYRLAQAKEIAAAAAPEPSSISDERGAIRERAANDQIATSVAQAKAADQKNAAEANYQKTLGNSAPLLARLKGELDGLVVGSTAYINKENEIAAVQEKANKAAKGAGATKLSDQQKLNNTLLTDQESANQKSEDAATAHATEVEKIEADFAAKILAQQKLNEESKRESEADFYDRLTSSALNKKKTGSAALKQIDAEYQAAFQKSQELAQAGQPKLAADYLALKQKQADQELGFQEKLQAAKDKKDKGEVSRLLAIQKLREDAAAQAEKDLLAAGDSEVNEKDQKLAASALKETDNQDKIALAAERTADRQIVAADRAGKKIDDQQAKLDKLKTTYNQTAPAAHDSAGTSSTPASGAAAADSAPGGDQSMAAVVAALNSAQDAIVAALGKVEGTTKTSGSGIERAVRSISTGRVA